MGNRPTRTAKALKARRNRKGIKVTEAVKAIIAERIGNNESMQAIANDLGLNKHTVWVYAVRFREEWRLARIEAIDRQRARELERLDMLEMEAIEAWEKSQEEEVRTEITTTDKENGQTIRQSRAGKSGDPRFLSQIERCIKSRREILGLDVPAKTETVVKHDGSILFGSLTPRQMLDEIKSRIAGLPGPVNGEVIDVPATDENDHDEST